MLTTGSISGKTIRLEQFYDRNNYSYIMQAVKTVWHSNTDNVHIQCDSAVDVMYVNFRPLLPADDSELDDGIPYGSWNGEILGLL